MKNINLKIQTLTMLSSLSVFSAHASTPIDPTVIECHFGSDQSKTILILRAESGEDLNFPDKGNFYHKVVPMFINDSLEAVEVLVDRQFSRGRDTAYVVTYTYNNPNFFANFTLKHRTNQPTAFGFYKDDTKLKDLTCTVGITPMQKFATPHTLGLCWDYNSETHRCGHL